MIGRRFGQLVVESLNRKAVGGKMWNCRCDCGNKTVIKSGHLATGHTLSCGCFRRQVTAGLRLLHGHARKNLHTKTYERWKGMHQRCHNPNHRSFRNYGGRGITVCERWFIFQNFLEDMGVAPDKMLIDRINNDGNYSPSNCRWTDPKTSAKNQRKRKDKHGLKSPANTKIAS